MTSILDKLEKKNQQLTSSEGASKLDKVEVKQNEQKEEIALCSKIKFRKPVVDIRGQPLDPPSLVPEIEIKPPDIIKDSAMNIVQNLSSQVEGTNFDVESEISITMDAVMLLFHIKASHADMKK